MYRIYSIFCLLMVSTLGSGQELISDYESIEKSDKTILKVVDGEQYMLKLTKLDSLVVYHVIDEVPELLYTRYFYGLADEYFFRTTDHFFLFNNATESFAYNFVADYIFKVPFPDGYSRNNWWYTYKDEVILRQSDDSYTLKREFYVDLNAETLKEFNPLEGCFAQNEKYLLRSYDTDDDQEVFISHDKITGAEVVIDSSQRYASYYQMLEEVFIYFKNDELIQYDFTTQSLSSLYAIGEDYRSKSLISNQNSKYHIIVITRNDFTTDLVYIDKETLEYVTYNIADRIDDVYPDIVDGKIILVATSKLLLFDPETSISIEVPSYARAVSDIMVIEDRYIVHLFYYGFKVYDLLTDIERNYDHENSVGSFYYSDYMKVGDSYQLSYHFNYDKANKLYEFNIQNETLIQSDVIPQSQVGLSDASIILQVDSISYVVTEQDIYLVKRGTFEKLNTNILKKVEYSNYKIIDNRLYWLEEVDGQSNIYYFDGEQVQLHSFIASPGGNPPFNSISVSNYVITGDFTFFSTYGVFISDLYKYDRRTGELIFIEALEGIVNNGMAGKDGYFYYYKDNKIRVITPTGDIEDFDLELSNWPISLFYEFKDQLIYQGENALYNMVGTESIFITNIEGPLSTGVTFTDDYITIDQGDNYFELYNGEELYSYQLLEDYRFTGQLSDRYLTFVKSIATNTTITALFDVVSQSYVDLPDQLEKSRLISIESNDTLDLLIASTGAFTDLQVKIYDITDGFDTYEELLAVESYTRYFNLDFKFNENGGLLYLFDKLIKVDKSFNFEVITNIKGDSKFSYLLQDKEDLYFLAIHSNKGRQVFGYTIPDGLIQEEEEENALEQILIYPNPSVEHLTVETDLVDNYTIEVLKSTGELMYVSKDKTQSISTINYSKGLYFVRILQNGKVYNSSSFVKM